MIKKYFVVLLIAIFSGCASVPAENKDVPQQHYLFVGNSITYIYDTPTIFRSILSANEISAEVDVISSPGKTMADHVEDGWAQKAISSKAYDAVFLQDVGGYLFCVLDEESASEPECADVIRSHERIAESAHRAGSKVFILGTYQKLPGAQRALSSAEARLSGLIGADGHVDQNELQNSAMKLQPTLPWFDNDGAHPGPYAALLTALGAYRELFHSWPSSTPTSSPVSIRSDLAPHCLPCSDPSQSRRQRVHVSRLTGLSGVICSNLSRVAGECH